jgi:peptidyl-dipeptidase A
VAPAPEDPKESEELSLLLTRLQSTYGKGKYTPPGAEGGTPGAAAGASEPLDLTALSNILAESRDEKKLLDAWQGWRTVSPPMRADYARFVTLSNKASREMGFTDTGAMWRAKYDMPADEFAKECDRLWEQVKPLYLKLHAYTRMKLRETYGKAAVPADGPIPAHLLGNMWAQSWDNVYPLLAPKGLDPGYDLNAILK